MSTSDEPPTAPFIACVLVQGFYILIIQKLWFRFKNSADLVDKVSYGFRISRNRQLQIVKHEWVSSLDASQNVVSTPSYAAISGG